MDQNHQHLLEDVQALLQETSNASSGFFQQCLRRLFDLIDEEPALSNVVKLAERKMDFDKWFAAQHPGEGSGFGELEWPRNRDEVLSIQISLFRAIADERVDHLDFASTFISTSPRYDDMVADLIQQVFQPMANTLLRRIERDFEQSTEVGKDVPASDRTVQIDHNSAQYGTVIRDLEALEEAVRGSNDYGDTEDQQQRLAEVGAMRRLLVATRVRVDALLALVRRGLEHFAITFADAVIGAIALGLLALLGGLTGLW